VFRRGKLDVSIRPPALWWGGQLRPGFRPATIKLLAAIMADPVAEVDDLLDAMGWDTLNTLRTKVGETRSLLACAALPVRIVSVGRDVGRGVAGFRLEVME
jgi:hypothetical protein